MPPLDFRGTWLTRDGHTAKITDFDNHTTLYSGELQGQAGLEVWDWNGNNVHTQQLDLMQRTSGFTK